MEAETSSTTLSSLTNGVRFGEHKLRKRLRRENLSKALFAAIRRRPQSFESEKGLETRVRPNAANASAIALALLPAPPSPRKRTK